MSIQLMIFGLVSLSVLLAFFTVYEFVFARNRAKNKRLHALKQRLGTEMPDVVQQASVLLKDQSVNPGLDKILRRILPSSEVLGQRLQRAGLSLGPGMFVACLIGLGLFACILLKFMLGLNFILALLGGVGVGFGGFHILLEFFMAQRNGAFTKTFPDAIDLIVRTVKSGLPVSEGIAVVGQEMAGPVADEFRKISEGMKIGETLEQALWAASKRLDNAEFNFFVISLVVQSETGGNLAETLDNLGDILRKRQQMKLKIRAMASEARASAYILRFLPFIMVGILEVMSPGYTAPLFNDGTGRILSAGALVSFSIGVFIMFKIVRFEI